MSSSQRRSAHAMRADVHAELERIRTRRNLVDNIAKAADAYVSAHDEHRGDTIEASDNLAEAVAKLRLHDIGVEAA